jgi:hypothetical protein
MKVLWALLAVLCGAFGALAVRRAIEVAVVRGLRPGAALRGLALGPAYSRIGGHTFDSPIWPDNDIRRQQRREVTP